MITTPQLTDNGSSADAKTAPIPFWDAPSLLIIIVNFRTPDLVIQCLQSLVPEIPTIPGAKVVIVENGSGDDSVERIGHAIAKAGWESWARLLPQEKNHGFAGGNNRGWAVAPLAEHVLLLNSDTIVHPGCLAPCLKTLSENETMGAMCCLVKNADGSPQNVTRTFPTPLRQFCRALGLPWSYPRLFGWADTDDLTWDRETVCREVDWLGGAFLLIRGDLVRQIGLLDEDFFFYGEDLEFSHRIWKAGYSRYYQPTAGSITHLGGGSSSPDDRPSNEKLNRQYRARYLIQRKCYGAAAELFLRSLDRVLWSSKVALRKWRHGSQDPTYLEAQRISAALRGSL